jgi:hypothetical protein
MFFEEPAALERFATASVQPAMSAERGAVAPFTAPLLLGARVRQSPAKGIEVIVPSPAGREGWFILPWSAAEDALHPSLMDRALVEALGPETATPGSIRRATLHAAESGLGGRAMRRATTNERAAYQRRLVLTKTALDQADAGFATPIFVDCGLQGITAPLPAAARRVGKFAGDLLAWLPKAPSEEERRRATALSARAAAIAGAADALIAATRAHLYELQGLRRRWEVDGPVWLTEAQRAEFVLDGWELLAGLWQMADEKDRVQSLRRCLALAPPMAEEMLSWPGCMPLTNPPQWPPSPAGAAFITASRAEAVITAWIARS